LHDLLDSIQAETTVRKVSQILMDSRVSGLRAIEYAQKQSTSLVSSWIIAGVDTYLTSQTLGAFSERNRLKTERNSNGFIPGEAAAAVLLKREPCQSGLSLVGLGFGRESATVESDLPLRSDGLSQAINEAFQSYGGSFKDVDYRIADVNGEEYGFKEGALALARTMRIRKSRFDTLHPADCVGEIGAASVPLMLGFVQDAHLKGYAPGSGVLLHTSNDNSERGAAILMATS
jgi:3-oxoacyl-[acyl-carrier-protein] synthase-1